MEKGEKEMKGTSVQKMVEINGQFSQGAESIKTKLGWHYLVDLYSSDSTLLNDEKFVMESLLQAAREAKVTIITSHSHKFSPHGVTGVVLLAESHISVHTWPEYKYAALDVFSCGENPIRAIDFIKKAFKVDKIVIKSVDRGLF